MKPSGLAAFRVTGGQFPPLQSRARHPVMDRDLTCYSAHPPTPNWPCNARLAVHFVLNFEQGREPSIGDGDPASEWGLTEYGSTSPGVIGRDLAAEGMFAYGSPVGLLRGVGPFARRGPALDLFR